MHVQLALVLQFGVVEEVALHPRARRRFTRPGAKLLHDAPNRDEFDLERIADDDLVQQRVTGSVIVAIGKAGHDGHLLRIERLGVLADQSFDVRGASDRDESCALDRKRLRRRHAGVDGVDLRIEDD